MPIKPFIILCTLLYFPFLLIAQADKYQGTWQAIGILSGDSSNSYSITLQIAAGEKKQLYPAQLKINLKEFSQLGGLTYSVPIPVSGNPLVIGGTAISEGGLSLSPN
mgnify:CR=1 FL=1